jgi:hypothetical protein
MSYKTKENKALITTHMITTTNKIIKKSLNLKIQKVTIKWKQNKINGIKFIIQQQLTIIK